MKTDILSFAELYNYLESLITSGKMTLEDIKDAIENKEKMEDDRK